MTIKKILIAVVFAIVMLASPLCAGTLTGKVVDAVTLAGVEGAQVYVYNTDNVIVSQLTTAQDGTFNIQNITGHFVIRVVRTGYSYSIFTANVGSATTDMGNLLLVPLATIRVSVKDNASVPLTNGVVRVIQNGNIVVARLDGASGDIQVSPGDYFVVFSAPFHTEQAFRVSVAPGEVKLFTSSLEPTPIDMMPVVQAVDVQLSSSNVNAGTEISLKAIATYNDGHKEDVTYAAAWDVKSAGMIYLPTLIATGAGTHTITASFGGKSGSSTLTVNFGKVRAIDVEASPLRIYTDQSATLTSYLIDMYGNRQPTSNVSYSASCGTIQNNVFRSNSACTAIVTAAYTTNTSIRDTVSITVVARDNYSPSKGRSSSGGSTSSSTSSDVSSSTSSDSIVSSHENYQQPQVIKLVKFVFPPSAYVGEVVEVTLLDDRSNPVDGVLITVVMPDGREISLVSRNGGKVTFIPATPGDYVFKSPRYVVSGTNVLTVKEVQMIEKPPIKPIDIGNKQQTQPSTTAESTSTSQRDMLGVIFAAFSGEISPVDAIKATMPLWTIIGVLIFAAAVFFVVYTYLVGNTQPADAKPQQTSEGTKQQVYVPAAIHQTTDNRPTIPKVSQSFTEAHQSSKSRNKEQAKKISDEIESLEQELKEKMARLKRLREEQQRL